MDQAMKYYIEYDGTMSSIRKLTADVDRINVDMEYPNFSAAKRDLVLYCMEMRDDWQGVLQAARRYRRDDV